MKLPDQADMFIYVVLMLVPTTIMGLVMISKLLPH